MENARLALVNHWTWRVSISDKSMRTAVKIRVGLQITIANTKMWMFIRQNLVGHIHIVSYYMYILMPHWMISRIYPCDTVWCHIFNSRIAKQNAYFGERTKTSETANSQPPTLDHHQSAPSPRYQFVSRSSWCCPCWLNRSKHRTRMNMHEVHRNPFSLRHFNWRWRDQICTKSIKIIQTPLSSPRSIDVWVHDWRIEHPNETSSTSWIVCSEKSSKSNISSWLDTVIIQLDNRSISIDVSVHKSWRNHAQAPKKL